MNICLISQSNKVKDFIYLIQKILKKGKGIDQVSQRLYKPLPTVRKFYNFQKSEYQKKQLKRPSNVFPAKQIKKKEKDQIQEKFQENQQFEILQSVKTIDSEDDEQIQSKNKNLKVIPKTFLQTMAYNLREQGLINKMRKTLQDQIIYLQECEVFYKNMEKKKEIILLSQQDLNATDRTPKLKAWSYHRAMQQMEILENELDSFLIPLGYQARECKEQDQLQQHRECLKVNLEQLQSYTSLNFFDNENIQQIIDFLILYHDAFVNCEKTKSILLQEGSLCDALQKLRNDASKIIAIIKQDYQTFSLQFQQNEEQNQLLNQILNIKLLHIALYFILEKAEYQPQQHKEVLVHVEKLNILESCFQQTFEGNLPLQKIFKLRKKQIKTLEMVINFINSSYPYNRAFLIEIFFVKEIYFLQGNITNFDYLKYLNDNIRLLQDTLILRGKFVSTINLQILDLKQLNSSEQIAQVITKTQQEQKKVKILSATDKQKKYIKQIAENNKTTQNFIEQKLKMQSQGGVIKSEIENKIDKLRANLLKENITKKHEEEQFNFLILKYRKQQNKDVKETKVCEKKHQDIAGQLIYIVSDARLKYYNQIQCSIYGQIINIYNQHFYKSGFPKSLSKNFDQKQVVIISTMKENIKALTQDFQLKLNQYFEDQNYKQYLDINGNKNYLLDAQKVDFINYSLYLSSKLLSLIKYHSTTYSIENYLNFFVPAIPDITPFSVKEYLFNSQKISENLYDVLQKNSDAQLRCEWASSLCNNIRCTQNQQDKLLQLIRRINHSFILQFEVIRHIYSELIVEIFHKNSFSFNPRQTAQTYIEKCLQQQLQNKIRYFPYLVGYILQTLESFFIYLEQEITSNLKIYYLISIIDNQNLNMNDLEKILTLNNINYDTDFSSVKIKIIQYIASLQPYQNQQIVDMIQQQIQLLEPQRVSTKQTLLDLLSENTKKPKRPLCNNYFEIIIEIQKFENQIFYLQLTDPNIREVLTGDSQSNFINISTQQNILIISINNQSIHPRTLCLTTNKPPKYYKLSMNGNSRILHQHEEPPTKFHCFLLLKYQLMTQKEMMNQYIYY